jgi:site-specific recombinase
VTLATPAPSAPDTIPAYREAVFAALPPDRRDDPALRRLAHRLDRFVTATDEGPRVDAWVQLSSVFRGPTPTDPPSQAARVRASTRLWSLLELLDAGPAVREPFLAALRLLVDHTGALGLFAEAGIPSGRGFLSEAGALLMDRLLPAPRGDAELRRLLVRMYPDMASAQRIAATPSRLFHRVLERVAPTDRPELWQHVRDAFQDAFRLLGARVQAHGLESQIRERSGFARLSDDPFHRFAAVSDDLIQRWRGEPVDPNRVATWRLAAAACREAMARVHGRLEQQGVDTGIVFSLEVMSRCLDRMERMVRIVTSPYGPERSAAIQDLLARLVTSAHQDRSLVHLVGWNTSLLQRKIVERAGEVGEHYIATTRQEYRRSWAAAAGGGLLTSLTAALKLTLSTLPLAAFGQGFLYGLNYSVSFVFMQHRHLILATKQPAMTAATLAGILRDRRGEGWVDQMVDFTARIVHSQLACATANVLAVSAGAVALDQTWHLVFRHPFLDGDTSHHVYETLSPLNSGTLFYAALTGVILWAASMVGGWLDNWAVYHRLPMAIAQHPLGDRWGRERLARWAAGFERHFGGWATSVSLGFMLGMTPAIGRFLGLPLDVRHVTLSTGMLALATSSLGGGWWSEGWFLRGLAGIVVMFVLNLGVSFALSLFTAARAYQLPMRDVLELGRRIGARLIRSPGDFILPPRTDYRPLEPEDVGESDAR